MWKLWLKKLGLAALNYCGFGMGVGICMLLLDWLHYTPPSFYDRYSIPVIFSLFVLCVVTIVVRTCWRMKDDGFGAKSGKQRRLFLRVLISHELWMDVTIFLVFALALCIGGLGYRVQWDNLRRFVDLLIPALTFAAVDYLLYVVSCTLADRLLQKLQRKREQ